MPKPHRPSTDVFLNIPYDKQFENLFIAYICGISAFGLGPRATIEIRSSAGRLDKILKLIRGCAYSIHDLSRVQLDPVAPRVPRFNMPFELGLSVALERIFMSGHKWFVFEADDHRLQKSLSDLNAVDPKIHGGTVGGVFAQHRNIFTRSGHQPTVQQMWRIYRDVRKRLPKILKEAGTKSLYTSSVFEDICVAAHASAKRNVP